MKYSVLMTVYKNDNPEFFYQSLQSMVDQTLKPDEIVLVKDGPVSQAIQDVIDLVDSRNENLIVQLQFERNLGLGLALQEGLNQCRNELVARMDSDDISFSERCQLQVLEFEKNPKLDIVGCPVEEFEGTIENVVSIRRVPLTNEEIHAFATRRDPFNHPSVMFRKSKVLEVGSYRDFRKNQDSDLWIRLLHTDSYAMNLPQVLLHFRFDESTYKKRKSWGNTKSLISIRYYAFTLGQCSFFDFLLVMTALLAVYILPVRFQKFFYRQYLRN
jgi:glycosyltransferase involved in cell wall biosynthesis